MDEESGFVRIENPDQSIYRIFSHRFLEEALRLRQLVPSITTWYTAVTSLRLHAGDRASGGSLARRPTASPQLGVAVHITITSTLSFFPFSIKSLAPPATFASTS